ncbi:hypothetical protein [Pseudomonas protegens]|uniref:hypothetical protein n=1 Tax=Pseudomonas protegens TaxID=380021 RepID=UPI00383AC965
MATKTSKRTGETSTTVAVGIRIDPKIKFALDIMGRLQKRSLTAVIEWAISQAIANQSAGLDGTTLTSMLDKIWSTDESIRLMNLAIYMPEALTYDELRIWETIKASRYFWMEYPDGSYSSDDIERLVTWLVTSNWKQLLEHVERYKSSPTIVPIGQDELIPF